MTFKNKNLMICAAAVGLFCNAQGTILSSAMADYFVWEDEKTGVLMSFPDTWKLTTQQKPDNIITILAPDDYGFHPQCRLSVREDGRFDVFPPPYYRAVQQIAFGRDYWEKAIYKYYNEPEVVVFGNEAGLGGAFASYVIIDYLSPGQENEESENVEMRALSMAGIYGGNSYMFECSAYREGFDQWRLIFQSIADSVTFDQHFAPFPHGYYRDFIHD